MFWTGMTRTPKVGASSAGSAESRLTIAGESSRSSDRRRAAAARKSGLAKVDHLPGKTAIRLRGIRGAGIARDGPTGERRLSEFHRLSNDAREHVVVADDTELIEHV